MRCMVQLKVGAQFCLRHLRWMQSVAMKQRQGNGLCKVAMPFQLRYMYNCSIYICCTLLVCLRCFDGWITDFYILRKDVEVVSQRVEEIRAAAGLQQLEEDIAALEAAAADSSLWDDRAKAQQTLQALTDAKEKLKLLNDFMTQV